MAESPSGRDGPPKPGRAREPSILEQDRAAALALTPISRETTARLDIYAAVLLEWQCRMNLVAPSTLPQLWTRHIADSLQLLRLAPEARVWIDLGSGAGFPGLAIACALADRPGVQVHLVESTAKKCAFLRESIQRTGVPAVVHCLRIEDFAKSFSRPADVVTARALAPLDRLIPLAAPLLKTGAIGLFLKGQDVEAELTAASKCWKVEAAVEPSATSPASGIVVVRKVVRR